MYRTRKPPYNEPPLGSCLSFGVRIGGENNGWHGVTTIAMLASSRLVFVKGCGVESFRAVTTDADDQLWILAQHTSTVVQTSLPTRGYEYKKKETL